ncbi:uncharacterized protein LOC101896939 isoform X1 [Musca domestica]|uniref:Uncharacterized protein LOC101896939 n=1 Tax=Musca domestica TaxID=7370 RepID=A0A1I8MWW1_MUSDO|nr:uncharacterized protein LOC101896939 isoform X1 [Musca domestica]
MATCCSIRKLNYLSAIFFLVVGVLGILICFIFFALSKDEKFWEEFGESKTWSYTFISIFLIYTLILVGTSIFLIIGLRKNRYDFMKPFIYTVYSGIVFTLSVAIRVFFKGLRKKQPVGQLALELFIDIAVCAFQGLLLYPVYKYYKDLKANRFLPEQHTLNGNQPLNKPNYHPIQGQA